MSHFHGEFARPEERVDPQQIDPNFFHPGDPGNQYPPPFIHSEVEPHTNGFVHSHTVPPSMNPPFGPPFGPQPQFVNPLFGYYFGPQPFDTPQFVNPLFGPHLGPQPPDTQQFGPPTFAHLPPPFKQPQIALPHIGPYQPGASSSGPGPMMASVFLLGPPRAQRSCLPSAPIIIPRYDTLREPESYAPAATGSRPPSTPEVKQEAFTPATVVNPDDIFRSATRPCHIAHRRYMKWIQVVYNPSTLPHTFVKDWHHALTELRLTFGFSCFPDLFVFNQFLAAVAVNPAAHQWIESLHVPLDEPPAVSLMGETYRDFLLFEARRLGLPRSTWES